MNGGFPGSSEANGGVAVKRPTKRRQEDDGVGESGLTCEDACLDCHARLVGPFCHECGQHAHVHRTLVSLWHDIAHGVFHFEGKVWRTLPMLLWRPGDLTRRYIHGERTSFVSPLALFLFSVFLMFTVFESFGGPIVPTTGGSNGSGFFQVDAGDFAADRATAEAKLAGLIAARRDAVSRGRSTVSLDRQIEEARSIVLNRTAATKVMNGVSAEDLPDAIQVDTGSKTFDDSVKAALKNPKLLLYKLQSSAYKFSWALIPLSLPFMWAIFAWRREYKLYDHAVFVTYSLVFVTLLLIIMALLAACGIATEWVLLLFPLHLFRQLKAAYRLSAGSALVRTFALLIVAPIVTTMFGLMLLTMGVSG